MTMKNGVLNRITALSAAAAIMLVLLFPSVAAVAQEPTELPQVTVANSSGEVIMSYDAEQNNEQANIGEIVTKAVRLAVDSGASDKNRYTVTVPKGKYYLSTTIYMYSYVTLDMRGATITATDKLAYNMLKFGKSTTNAPANNTVGYNGYVGITIRGGTLDMNFVNSSCIVRLAHARDILFDSVKFLNNMDSHHVETAAVKNLTFSGCTFKGQKCSSSAGSNTKEALQLDILADNGHFTGYAEYDGTQTNDVTITDCSFSHVYRGIGTSWKYGNTYFSGVTITNNRFSSLYTDAKYYGSYTGEAIFLVGYKKLTVTGNAVAAPYNGIYLSDVKNSTVADNSLIKRGAKSAGTAVKLSECKQMKVENNTIEKYANGISVNYGSSNTVKKNIMQNLSGNGVTLSYAGESCTVANNSVTKANGVGLYIGWQTGGKYSGNTVYSSNSGAFIRGTAPLFQRNTLDSSTNTGIEIEGSSVVLKRNRVTQSGKQGITIKSGEPQLLSNKLLQNTRSGLYIKGGEPTVKNNNIMKNGRYGIYVCRKQSAQIMKNNYSDNKRGDGVVVRLRKKVVFTGISRPVKLSLTCDAKTIRMSWQGVEGATKYTVFRAAEKDGEYTEIGSVSYRKTEFADETAKKYGKPYFYKVRATRKIANVYIHSYNSSTRTITPLKHKRAESMRS